jgi:phosphohistidine phosphatase
MNMEVYLIRHGLAGERGDYEDDNLRPLTEEGRQKTNKVAKQLVKMGLSFEIVLTSPLVRASQTAEILKKAGLGDRLETFAPLAPGGNIQEWVDWYFQWYSKEAKSPIALVGHQPDLGCWAETLVWGKTEEKLVLKKAGTIGLQVPEISKPIGKSELFLLISPKWLLLN